MNICKTTVKEESSCNFCSRGELNPDGVGLVYPYKRVYTLSRDIGSGLMVVICEECLKDLKNVIEELANNMAGENWLKHTGTIDARQLDKGKGSSKMNECLKKIIIVDDCVQCPIQDNCKEWKKLTKKQRVFVTFGVGVGKALLKTCPLADYNDKNK